MVEVALREIEEEVLERECIILSTREVVSLTNFLVKVVVRIIVTSVRILVDLILLFKGRRIYLKRLSEKKS
jgi:hypothetical protein